MCWFVIGCLSKCGGWGERERKERKKEKNGRCFFIFIFVLAIWAKQKLLTVVHFHNSRVPISFSRTHTYMFSILFY